MPDLKMPPERDFGFYQRRKHDKWRAVAPPEPTLEAPVADSHAHVHMLPDPAWELVRCAANGVDWLCMIVDPSEDGPRPFDELGRWVGEAERFLQDFAPVLAKITLVENNAEATTRKIDQEGSFQPFEALKSTSSTAEPFQRTEILAESGAEPANSAECTPVAYVPEVRIAVGVHPHNAKLYNQMLEAELVARLAGPRVAALGEIGLDYYYDLSPRGVQRDVFRRQIELAQERDLPIALHLRGGEDPEHDNAHREAFAILREADALGPRTLLHCCTLPPDELRPWVDADCYIAFGGAITFKNADAAREGARLVPEDRLLLETDSPYMTPEPMRGAACTPAHVIYTAAALAVLHGAAPGPARKSFLERIHGNTLNFYR